MTDQDRAASALLAVFPTRESYTRFVDIPENLKTVRSFVDFAAVNGVIHDADEDLLEDFVATNARTGEMCTPPNHLTFEMFFDQKEELLELSLSVRALTNRINALLSEHEIELPDVSNSMLTRFKKEPADTPHKQNVLRSLAFWLGHDRGHLGPRWNFETLLKMCSEGKSQNDYKEGVRIGFALYSRGDVIDHEIVGWLKREVKSYIEASIGHFAFGRWGKVRSHDITTLYVDFPKEGRHATPVSYRQCLRSAISLAHQITIRWFLSEHYSQSRFLSIGIGAGNFATLGGQLLSIVNTKLPGDPVIRLTDYARQCILINDIRVQLGSRPAEISLFKDETLTIWWVVGFWSTLYFDFIPTLLKDELLQNNLTANLKLATILWSPGPADERTVGDDANAIAIFFRFPNNSLLGMEIVKVLYYRKRFWEAIEILRIILSLDPTHLPARTMRMVALRNLAADAPTYAITQALFDQVVQEAAFIQQYCGMPTEDFFCEYGVAYLSHAMLTLRYVRNSLDTLEKGDTVESLKNKVYTCIAKADDLFGMGLKISPHSPRANYMLNTIRVIKNVLKNDESLFIDPKRPISGKLEAISEPTRQYQWQQGYLREDFPPAHPNEILEVIFNFLNMNHDESISFPAYRPTVYFCMAVAWWDMFPVRTVTIAKRTLNLLKQAAAIAKEMENHDIYLYSFTRVFGDIMPVKEFIVHVEKGIRMIEEQAGPDLHKREDGEIITPKDKEQMGLLMTLNF